MTTPNDNTRLFFFVFLSVTFRITQIKIVIPIIKINGSNNSVIDKKLVLFEKMKTMGNKAKRIG